MPNKKELQKTPKNVLVDLYMDLHEQKEEAERLSQQYKKKAEYLEKKIKQAQEATSELWGGVLAHQESSCKESTSQKEKDSNMSIGVVVPQLKNKTDPHSLMIDWIASRVSFLNYKHLRYSEGDEETKQQRKPYQLF